jgi:ketosteroid isomerase-like protein
LSKTLTTQHLDALFDAFNRHDVDGVMSFFSPDCVFDGVAGPDVFGKRFDTTKDIAAAFAGVFASFKDARWDVYGSFIAGDRAVSEWKFSGTQADGQRVEADGVDIFAHKDGLITRKNAFRKQRPLLPPSA